MATQPLNVENVRTKLDPQFAEFLLNGEAQSVPMDNAREVKIAWSFSTNDEYNQAERFLAAYTWPGNDKPKRYAEDLVIRGVTLEGLWRQAFITRVERLDSSRKREFLLVLTLRRGFSTTLDWDEALLQEQRETDGNSVEVAGISNTASLDRAKILTVTFPNIAPDAIGTVLAAIPSVVQSTEETPIKVQGVELTDEWHRAFAVSQKRDDGTSSVLCTLTRNRFTVELYQAYGTPGARTGYRIYDVPRSLEAGIKTAWQGTGRSADTSLSLDRDLCVVTLWTNIDGDDEFNHWAARNCQYYVQRIVSTGIEEVPDVPAEEIGVQYTSSFQISADTGLYSGWIEKRVRQTQTTGKYRSLNTHGQYAMTQTYEGLYPITGGYNSVALSFDEETGALVQTATAITLPPTVLDPLDTWQVSKRVNEDCTCDITIQENKAIDQEGSGSLKHKFEEVADETHTQGDELGVAVSVPGTIQENSSRPTQEGKFSTSSRLRTAQTVDPTGGTVSATIFETQDGDSARNLVLEPEADAFQVGKIKQFRKQLNEFGRWDKEGSERTAIEVDPTGGTVSATTFETQDGASARNLVAEPVAAAVESGKIKQFRKNLNDFGRWDKEGSERTAITVEDANTVETENTFEESERDTIRNKAGIKRAAVSAAGVIQTVTAEKSEFPDRIHDTLEERTAKTVADANKTETATKFETQDADTIRNAATAREVTVEVGKIKTQRVEKSEFPDRVHDTVEERTAVEVGSAVKTKQIAKFETAETTVDRNKAAAIVEEITQTAGKIKQTRNTVNDFDRNDHETQERTATTVSDAVKVKQIDAFSSVASDTDRNQTLAAVEETTQTPGKIKQTRAQLNDFDRYDNTEEERSAIERADTGGTVSATTFETQDGASARNLAVEPEPDATEAGKIKSFRKSLNEFLRWDKEGTERTAITVEDAQEETTKSLFEDVESDTIRNKSAAARVAVQTDGEIQTVRVEKSEFPERIHDTLTRRIANFVAGFLKGFRDTDAVYEETTGDRNAAAAHAVVLVDTAAGKITEVSSEKNQYGRYDRRKVERTAKNQESTDTSSGHLSTAATVKNTQAAAPAAAVAGVGERVTVQNDETEFGKHRTAVQTETAVEESATDHDKTGLSERVTENTWNGAEVVVPPVRADGTAVTLVQSPTPFKDKWNIAEATETGTPWDTGWIEYSNVNGANTVRFWGNQTEAFGVAIAAALVATKANTFSHRRNRFGRYDGSASSQNATGAADATFWFSTQDRTRTYKQVRYVGADVYSRTVTETVKRSVSQTLGNAYSLFDSYWAAMPATAEPAQRKVGQTTSNGRVGYLAIVSWVVPVTGADGEWAEE